VTLSKRLGSRLKSFLVYKFGQIYVIFFASKLLSRLNNKILTLALKAKGFNNYSSNLEESGELALIQRVINLGIDEMFDVGANIGQYSNIFLKSSNARIFAFEPMEGSFKKLLSIKLQNNRLVPFNLALGAYEYETDIFFGSETDQLATISPEVLQIPYVGKNNSRSKRINVRTLDQVFLEIQNQYKVSKLDCIKIDTEGFELDVLKGASRVLDEIKPKAIILEWNWHQLFRGGTLLQIQELLPDYQAFRVLPYKKGLYPVDTTRPEENIYHYSNYVFVRSDLVRRFLQD
jgi:FkbM family methyltransferase